MNKAELIPLKPVDLPLILNLAKYYEYDMSHYCGKVPGWEFPVNGIYESDLMISNIKRYFTQPEKYPFLIRLDESPAGFVMINNEGMTPEIDWVMGEFFILAPYQRRKIGLQIAIQIFDQFPGIWEVPVIPENKRALVFWKKVISSYSGGKYHMDEKIALPPKPHQMIVFNFEALDN